MSSKSTHSLSKKFKRIPRKAKKTVVRIVRKLGNGVQRLLNPFIFNTLYPWYFRRCAKTPAQKNMVLFVEPMYAELSNNLTLIHDELVNTYDFPVAELFANHARAKWFKKVTENFGFIKEIATAEYIFISNTSQLINVLPLRSETKLIQTWHGCGAFKKFGFSIGDGAGANKNYELFKLHSNYTHVFVSGREAVGPYIDAMRLQKRPEIVHPDGVSRTDVFFDEAAKQAAFEKVYELYPQARGKRIILWGPTYRGRVSDARNPKGFELDELYNGIDHEKYVLFINRHPLVKKPVCAPQGVPDGFVFDVTKKLSIEELLFVSDICISDYSSLVFEFSLFKRPIIFFTPDLEQYYNRRGFYYPFEEFVCGPICKTIEEVISEINSIDSFDLEAVDEFRDKFMNGCDGHATERILKRVFGEDLLEAHRKH